MKQSTNLTELNDIGDHHSFMSNLRKVAVMNDTNGADCAWWSDYRSHSEQTKSQLTVTNFCQKDTVRVVHKRDNIETVEADMSNTNYGPDSFDFIWAADCFQKSTNPIATLTHWWSILKENGMLVIGIPQSNYIDDLGRWQVVNKPGEYFNWNLVNLIQTLAVCGFDCRDGHFKMKQHQSMIWASVYKGEQEPIDPTESTWYKLQELNLTPKTMDSSITKRGYPSWNDLKFNWLDGRLYDLAVETLP